VLNDDVCNDGNDDALDDDAVVDDEDDALDEEEMVVCDWGSAQAPNNPRKYISCVERITTSRPRKKYVYEPIATLALDALDESSAFCCFKYALNRAMFLYSPRLISR
jgi:hypothetical protein